MFDRYYELIKNLDTFEKKDILNNKFELYHNNLFKIFYAPHNEIVNEKAKVLIVGITPGWTQTAIAYKTAHDCLLRNLDFDEIKKCCKRNSRFAGSMRKNIISMLDEINLNVKLGIDSCFSLFEDDDYLLHTTSLIPYPVFVKDKNYTGHSPKILDNDILLSYVKQYFYQEIEKLGEVLIIPLGKAVEEVLEVMIMENVIKNEQCLFGFPHPSGANGHRKSQFLDNKDNLINIVNNYFNK